MARRAFPAIVSSTTLPVLLVMIFGGACSIGVSPPPMPPSAHPQPSSRSDQPNDNGNNRKKPNDGRTPGTGKPSDVTTSTSAPPSPPGPALTTPGDTRQVIGNVLMSPQNVHCTYVPHGNLDGTDSLTVLAYILLIGASELPGTVKSSMSISNGYSRTYTGGQSNQSPAYFQGPIYLADWGKALTVRLRADPDDRYRETNEADNAITVTVNLPARRPDHYIDSLSCSGRRVT